MLGLEPSVDTPQWAFSKLNSVLMPARPLLFPRCDLSHLDLMALAWKMMAEQPLARGRDDVWAAKYCGVEVVLTKSAQSEHPAFIESLALEGRGWKIGFEFDSRTREDVWLIRRGNQSPAGQIRDVVIIGHIHARADLSTIKQLGFLDTYAE